MRSGVLEAGTYALCANKGRKERIGRLLMMHANNREDIKVARTGDIIAVAGLKDVITGETLCDEKQPIMLERMEFPGALNVHQPASSLNPAVRWHYSLPSGMPLWCPEESSPSWQDTLGWINHIAAVASSKVYPCTAFPMSLWTHSCRITCTHTPHKIDISS